MRARLMLGTPEPHWLWDPDPRFDGVTLFVSRSRLARRKTEFPKALHDFCIDSGGFTELQRHGRWRITAAEYVAEVRRYVAELGPDKCRWIAPQDWMCEDLVIYGGIAPRGLVFHGTREARGLKPGDPEQDLTTAVRLHQRYTVDNYLELTRLAPELDFIPVLQGRLLEDYEVCAQMYADAGVDLKAAAVVGLGSVCRRESTEEIAEIVDFFEDLGLSLHGFGVKSQGLELYGDQLTSADSQAWSDAARRQGIRHPGCTHQKCSNCKEQALRWHRRAKNTTVRSRQMAFPLGAAA